MSLVWNGQAVMAFASGANHAISRDGITWDVATTPASLAYAPATSVSNTSFLVLKGSGTIAYVATYLSPPPPPPPNNSDAIVFDQLLATTPSPETDGALSASIPVLRFRASDLPETMELDLPALRFVGTGFSTEAHFGALIASLPALQFIADNLLVGIITTERGSMRMALPALQFRGNSIAVTTPQNADLIAAMPALQFVASGFARDFGALIAQFPAVEALFAEVGGNSLRMDLPPVSFSSRDVNTIPQAYMTLRVQPIMSALISNTWVIDSTLTLSDTAIDELAFILQSRLDLADQLTPLGVFVTTITSSFVARDFVRFVLEMALDETLTLSDPQEITIEAILAIASQLVLQDETIPWLSAIAVVTSALVLQDRVRYDVTNTITDAVSFADALEADLTLITQLISEVVLADEIDGGLTIVGMVSDTISFGDETDALLTLLMTIDDGVAFATRFRTPEGDTYAGYAVNIRNTAVSELTNFPFNSFATVQRGGLRLTLAAGQDGIYQLGGPNDDGTPIDASLRLGLTDFGSNQLKRVANGFIGYTSDGELKLVTITTDGGRKKENWYKLKARSAHSAVDGRFDIAKGLVARYWGWKVENIAGADFSIDDLKVSVALLQRRKSGR
jgi:hypothetical protein